MCVGMQSCNYISIQLLSYTILYLVETKKIKCDPHVLYTYYSISKLHGYTFTKQIEEKIHANIVTAD